MNTPDKRTYKRVQFFLLPQENDYLPVWVFNLQTPGQTQAGLVVDLSPSGVQVLTDVNEPLSDQQFEITFLGDNKDDFADLPSCRIDTVWSRPEGSLYTRTGFSFVSKEEAEPTIKSLLSWNEHGHQDFVRCALRDLSTVDT